MISKYPRHLQLRHIICLYIHTLSTSTIYYTTINNYPISNLEFSSIRRRCSAWSHFILTRIHCQLSCTKSRAEISFQRYLCCHSSTGDLEIRRKNTRSIRQCDGLQLDPTIGPTMYVFSAGKRLEATATL